MATSAVCLIEDDEDTRRVERWLFEGEGYRVLEAANGSAGLAVLRRSLERLVVLLDYQLPELDGCDVLRRVTHEATLRERHAVIVLTASPQRAMAECGKLLDELGVGLVPKPFDLDAIVAMVGEAAERLTAS